MINERPKAPMLHRADIDGFITVEHDVDFCVVGGGLAGMFAAIAAARHGLRVVLMQDRPVLGGNASSEVRMCIRGAHGDNNRETGILEEIALESMYRNPDNNFSIWDSVLYEKVYMEKNITLLLNCSCCDAEMDGNRIHSIRGWQTTTQVWHTVRANLFADCSGDSVLAPITGAEWRMGRESREEFDEDILPPESDNRTMGMSCLFQVREKTYPVKFTPPTWANKYSREDFKFKLGLNPPTKWTTDNYWWMELGGMYDSIHDTEELRDELLKVAFGCWDFIKNSGEVESDNWDMEWLGFLPGKRESRRYVGDHILTQNDVRSEGKFEDLIAYGGWSMDDHNPGGMASRERPTIYNAAPSPYGIPYRCLYSRNIENLYFAGRNISTTHAALSSTRVMATCGILGQAVGTAASIAVKKRLTPRGVCEHAGELQQTLLRDGCYLPWHRKQMSGCMNGAAYSANANADMLCDGLERIIDGADHAYEGALHEPVILSLPEARDIRSVRLVFDSDINRHSYESFRGFVRAYPMKFNVYLDDKPMIVPDTIIKRFELYADSGSGWELVQAEENNYQRQRIIPIGREIKAVKLVPLETWGYKTARLYAFEAE